MWRSLPLAARVYIVALTAAGSLTIAHSIYSLVAHPIGAGWFILALLTLVSGSATLKLPALPATISVSETFVFASVLLFGPASGTLIVALDALVISLWSLRHKNPLYKIAFNVLALPVAIWVGSQVFFASAGIEPLVRQSEAVGVASLLWPLLLFTLSYFLLNSWIIAIAISLERGISALRIWRENFAWISLNYFGGASVAALLVSYTRSIEFSQLAIIVPLLLVSYLTFATSMGRAEDTNRHLLQLNQLYMSTIETLAMAIDAKDQITHGHIRRVQMYAIGLARDLGVSDEPQIKAIEAAALLHDMGKLGVPDYILNKPGPLTDSEFSRMKRHASIGAEILSSIDFPYPVVPIVRHHHENWDGSGYPDGLQGTEIPIGARILSVVDCFDALTSDRPYRPKLSDQEALRMLRERRGVMYDPLVVDVFVLAYPRLAAGVRAEEEAVKHPFFEITQSAGTGAQRSDPRFLASSMTDADSGAVVRLLETAKSRLGDVTLALYQVATDSGGLVARHVVGENDTLTPGNKISVGEHITGWVAANRVAVLNSDARLELRSENADSDRRCSALPVLGGDELLGVLTAYSKPGARFGDADLSVLEDAASRLGELLASVPSSAEESPDDSETFASVLAAMNILGDGSQAVSFLVIQFEPDGASDRHLLTLVRQCLRSTDALFRYAPNEFVAVLGNTSELLARGIAGRLLREASIQLAAGVRVGVATSIESNSGLLHTLRLARADAERAGSSGPAGQVH